jgi:hypothetical protein
MLGLVIMVVGGYLTIFFPQLFYLIRDAFFLFGFAFILFGYRYPSRKNKPIEKPRIRIDSPVGIVLFIGLVTFFTGLGFGYVAILVHDSQLIISSFSVMIIGFIIAFVGHSLGTKNRKVNS